MRLNQHCRAAAFSLLELLCVIAIIAVLAALLLPALSQAKAKAKRLQCIHQLRQMGLAFQNFAQDHNGQFPMAVPGSLGGSLEFAQTAYRLAGPFYFSFHHFQTLSNELSTPRLLVCPADTRLPAGGFASLSNENLSYAVGLNADASRPNSILACDRNLTNDWLGQGSLVRLGPKDSLRWTRELHEFKGDLLFADGHVEHVNSPGLAATRNQLPIIADLVLPSIGRAGTLVHSNPSGPPGTTGPAISGTVQSAVPPRPEKPPSPAAPVGMPPTLTSSSATAPRSATPQANVGGIPDIPTIASAVFLTNVSVASPATPGASEDPGFSLFPESFTRAVVRIAKGIAWLALLLIALLLVGMGLKKRAQRKSPNWTRYEGP